jgi:hypothetical protein
LFSHIIGLKEVFGGLAPGPLALFLSNLANVTPLVRKRRKKGVIHSFDFQSAQIGAFSRE